MAYDKDTILDAWKKAVNHGIIDTNVLRPEVARSWSRCMSCGVDPWSVDFPKTDNALLQVAQKKHAAVMEAAAPILQYLLTIFNCNASLADMHGFVFDLVTPLSSYPRTLGTYVSEALNGNGNITIAIQEQKPYRVDGYEHFRAIAQNYSGVAAIVHCPRDEKYVLCMNDPFAVLPDNALDICIAAAQLVEKLCVSRREVFSQLSSASFFDPIIASDELTIIVTDQDGMILTANASGKEVLSGFDKFPYASRSLGEYLRNRHSLTLLLDGGDGEAMDGPFAFKGVGRGKGCEMRLLRRRRIELVNGMKHCVLIFENPVDAEPKENAPAVAAERGEGDCVGRSPQWNQVMELISSVAVHKSNVMIMGETGTGKEVAARALHRMSGRGGEFVAINCGALPRDLLASELFGYEGGAFTGARSSGAKGKFEYANGGTLFLDEIGDMPVDMQVSLLRVLQEQCVVRIGSNKPIPINVRIVAATNQDLQKRIGEGKFRSDLWYRLSVIEINLPRLADREGDVSLLAEHFNARLSESLNIKYRPLSQEVLDFLESYSWPGNVRELKNVMEKALIVSGGGPVTVSCFPKSMRRSLPQPEEKTLVSRPASAALPAEAEKPQMPRSAMRQQMEREKILKVLEEEGGNISRSAKRLDMSRNTLYRKIEKYDIHLKIQAVAENN